MNDPVWPLMAFIGVGLVFVVGVIAVILIEATNE